MNYARRTDTTHAPIRDALRRIGATVLDTHAMGEGFPDLVVGYRKRTTLIECKWRRPTREGGSHGESQLQRELRESWRGADWIVVDSPDEALRHVAGVGP